MLNKIKLSPFIHTSSTTRFVMLDVIIAMLPMVFVAFLAYGMLALQLIGIAILTSIVTEWIFAKILLQKNSTIFDGSAIITSMLLVFTVSPATPWYVIVFGVAAAIVFGKILWGGLGKNLFNPALVGREFMVVFFASIMTSPTIWKTSTLVNLPSLSTNSASGVDNYLLQLIFKTGGALGEYSILAIVVGGIYLLLRNRISWHIPFSILVGFVLLLWIFGSSNLEYSIAGILLGTIFMATDLPSSPTTKYGKLYYGLMIGIAIYCFIVGGCRYEYMSYAILLMNAFSHQISTVFKPRVWGTKINKEEMISSIFILTLKIFIAILAVLSIHYYNLVSYAVYIYIVYIIFKFNFSTSKKINNII